MNNHNQDDNSPWISSGIPSYSDQFLDDSALDDFLVESEDFDGAYSGGQGNGNTYEGPNSDWFIPVEYPALPAAPTSVPYSHIDLPYDVNVNDLAPTFNSGDGRVTQLAWGYDTDDLHPSNMSGTLPPVGRRPHQRLSRLGDWGDGTAAGVDDGTHQSSRGGTTDAGTESNVETAPATDGSRDEDKSKKKDKSDDQKGGKKH